MTSKNGTLKVTTLVEVQGGAPRQQIKHVFGHTCVSQKRASATVIP